MGGWDTTLITSVFILQHLMCKVKHLPQLDSKLQEMGLALAGLWEVDEKQPTMQGHKQGEPAFPQVGWQDSERQHSSQASASPFLAPGNSRILPPPPSLLGYLQ